MNLLETTNKKIWLSNPEMYEWLDVPEEFITSKLKPKKIIIRIKPQE
jgi:hypothetical protein